MDLQYIPPDLSGEGLTIGIVTSRFNEPICWGLRDACLEELTRLGVGAQDITLITVPGALEIPLALQYMAQAHQFDALIALGAVIRGETYHFEVVSNQSAAGLAQVSMDFDIPIANAILTVENEEQARARMEEQGANAAAVAVEMANLCIALDNTDTEETFS